MNFCNIFFEEYSSGYANFTEDNSSYKCGPILNEFMNDLEITTEKLFK